MSKCLRSVVWLALAMLVVVGFGVPINGSDFKFEVFRSLVIGDGPKTARDLGNAIKAKGMPVGEWAGEILSKNRLALITEKKVINLVVVSVSDLGFTRGASLGKIYARAKEQG